MGLGSAIPLPRWVSSALGLQTKRCSPLAPLAPAFPSSLADLFLKFNGLTSTRFGFFATLTVLTSGIEEILFGGVRSVNSLKAAW